MRRANRLYILLMLGALAAACGGKQSPVGPSASPSPAATSPAAAPAAPVPAVGGASISGVVRGTVGAARVTAASATGVKVSVSGTSISTMTDAGGQFTLNGVPAGNVTLAFEGNGASAALALTVAEGQQVSISVTMNGSSASLDASQSVLGTSIEIEGTISGFTGTCPALVTFTLNGKTIKTDATTVFDGTPCASLLNGDKAEVTGVAQPDTSILASKVEVKKAPEVPKVPDSTTEVEGTISGLAGVCPTLSFVVNGKTIKTDAATLFDQTTCAMLANGQSADVKGTVQPDSSILASKVEVSSEDDDEDGNKGEKGKGTEVEGDISGLTGVCPTLTFVISGKTIKTNSATKFDSSSCSSLANGQSAEVEGTVQADTTILASDVEVEKSGGKDGDDDDEDGGNGNGGGGGGKGGKGGKGKDD